MNNYCITLNAPLPKEASELTIKPKENEPYDLLTDRQPSKAYNVTQIQQQINSGLCWKLEGSIGRFASDMLQAGVCMLPKKRVIDYYGQVVPSRLDLKAGTKGTFQNAVRFWVKVMDGDFDAVKWLDSTFAC